MGMPSGELLCIFIDVALFWEVVGIFDDVVVLLSLEVFGMLVVVVTLSVTRIIFVVMLV